MTIYKEDSLGARMKQYEYVSQSSLTQRMPMIIRVDGRAFHTATRHCQKPWDAAVKQAMIDVAMSLCDEISGAKFAFWFSDEVSVFTTDYDTLNTQAWFDKNVQKIASVSASIATAAFNASIAATYQSFRATFDGRVFVLPKSEVCNYALWRQQDATRNSIQMLAQSHFSPKQLHGLNNAEVQEKLFTEANINWNDCTVWQKRGVCIIRDELGMWKPDYNIPIFSQDRSYVERFVYLKEKDKSE